MSYLLLAPDVSLRYLERPYLYNRKTDELYELDEEAWKYLLAVAGPNPPSAEAGASEFVDFLVAEGLARVVGVSARVVDVPPAPGAVPVGRQSPPSLRYLELYLTQRCNLRCAHCFLGDKAGGDNGAALVDLPIDQAEAALKEFDSLGGLRLLLTGGEPLLYPGFWEINALLPRHGFRTVLLTNGTLLASCAAQLNVQEVQVSLDGWEEAHDALRGKGSFRKALRGLEAAREAGLDVSVATMVTRFNREDFPRLSALLQDLGVRAWNVDVPTPVGTLLKHKDLLLPPAEAARYLDWGFGGAVHESSPGATCGAHLMAIFADGTAAKCGFYYDSPVGRVEEGLRVLWERVPRLPMEALACDCPVRDVCRGGCRFRATVVGGTDQPDIVKCYHYGVLPTSTAEGGER